MRYVVRLAFSFAFVLFITTNTACAQNTNATNPAAATTSAATAAPTAANSAATPVPNDHPVSGVEGGHNAVYTDLIPPDQIVTLAAGDDKFQGWHIADLSGQPRGAAIVLHDSGHLPSWPFTAAALINDLPLHGWNTLNIELPTPAADQLPAKTATPPAQVELRTQARISAAIKYFSDQNQHNIVLIGFGSGAIRAAEAVRLIARANAVDPAKTEPLTALVMISPQQQLDGIDMDLPKLLPLTTIPALDMTLDSSSQTRADAEARRRAVLHQRTRIYTALELPPINDTSDAQHSPMVRRVQAWLQVNAHAPQKPAAAGQARS